VWSPLYRHPARKLEALHFEQWVKGHSWGTWGRVGIHDGRLLVHDGRCNEEEMLSFSARMDG
jgi:hypothetical protein